MGSLWRIAFWKSPAAFGLASRPRIMCAPELCPATVMRFGSPPKPPMTFLVKVKAVMTSARERFGVPTGAEAGGRRPRTPRRYWKQSQASVSDGEFQTETNEGLTCITTTMTPFALANCLPFRPGAEAEPAMKEPPWIQTTTVCRR
jgi:hypothetical protein